MTATAAAAPVTIGAAAMAKPARVLGDQHLVTGHPVGQQLPQTAALLLSGDAVVGQQQGHQRGQRPGDEDPIGVDPEQHGVAVGALLEAPYMLGLMGQGYVRQAAAVPAAGEGQPGWRQPEVVCRTVQPGQGVRGVPDGLFVLLHTEEIALALFRDAQVPDSGSEDEEPHDRPIAHREAQAPQVLEKLLPDENAQQSCQPIWRRDEPAQAEDEGERVGGEQHTQVGTRATQERGDGGTIVREARHVRSVDPVSEFEKPPAPFFKPSQSLLARVQLVLRH